MTCPFCGQPLDGTSVVGVWVHCLNCGYLWAVVDGEPRSIQGAGALTAGMASALIVKEIG